MHPLLGLNLDGPALTSFDDHAPGQGSIGKPVWGPSQFLRDLELRLGLNTPVSTDALRVACWAARLAELAPRGRFYSRSFAVDALGTAWALLRMRDALVEANWNGQGIPGGGDRLAALAELETLSSLALPPGKNADRLAEVARVLEAHPLCVYEELTLAEPEALWSGCFQRIFQALARVGTRITQHAAVLPGADTASDLGKVQAMLNGVSTSPGALTGDGSLVLLTAETSWEAAHAAAALLARFDSHDSVVIREGDVAALEHALSATGLATQGVGPASPWRTALQLLPLCLELAFEPKDPYRVLELLMLPAGPFAGRLGHKLARALSRSPGIGSPAWQAAKVGIVPSELEKLAWLEAPGAHALLGASKEELLQVITRVRDWLVAHVGHPKLGTTVGAAIGQCDALTQALAIGMAPRLTLVEVRRRLEFVGATGVQAAVSPELAGRIARVSSADGLWAARENVVWWSFSQQYLRSPDLIWRRQELAALAAAGVSFPDPRLRLLSQSAGWRRAVLAARKRLILVAPRTRAGDKLAAHALWDELVARLKLDPSACARITLTAGQLVTGTSPLCAKLPVPAHEPLTELPLPGGHAEWVAEVEPWPVVDRHSPSSLNALLGCSLQWGLRYRAGLRSEVLRLPAQHFLNGSLGHRLIEVLHEQGAFDLPEPALRARAESEIDKLFSSEGAVLLRPGKAAERSQVRRQLVTAVGTLTRALQVAGLRILAVEHDVVVPWQGTHLDGRIDLLVGNDAGECAIIDVKWGYSGHRDLLKSGEALQLAAYSHALETQRASTGMQAAYFALQRGALVGPANTTLIAAETVAGSDLKETWQRVERTFDLALRRVVEGHFAVAGVSASPPLLTSLGLAESVHKSHFALIPEHACKYCDFGALCGKRWEDEAL